MQTTWRIVNTSIQQFQRFDAKKFCDAYRSEGPTLIVYRLRNLPWTGVVRVAPFGSALCALAYDYPVVVRAEHAWTSVIVDDPGIHKLFLSELRASGLARDTIPPTLFGGYVCWSAYAESTDGVFGKNAPDMGLHRAASHLLPNTATEAVIAYHQQQLAQFGSYALVPAPEGIEHSIADKDNFYPDIKILNNLAPFRVPDKAGYKKAIEETRSQLELALASPDDIDHRTLPLHYKHIVRPPLGFRIAHLGWGEGLYDLQEEVMVLRAKLVRRLGWPQMYQSIYLDLEKLRKTADVTSSSSFSGRIQKELVGYLGDMEQKYPVILENPLGCL